MPRVEQQRQRQSHLGGSSVQETSRVKTRAQLRAERLRGQTQLRTDKVQRIRTRQMRLSEDDDVEEEEDEERMDMDRRRITAQVTYTSTSTSTSTARRSSSRRS